MSSSAMLDAPAVNAASPVRAFVNSAWSQLLLPPLVVVRWWGLFTQFLARAIARQYRANALGFLFPEGWYFTK